MRKFVPVLLLIALALALLANRAYQSAGKGSSADVQPPSYPSLADVRRHEAATVAAADDGKREIERSCVNVLGRAIRPPDSTSDAYARYSQRVEAKVDAALPNLASSADPVVLVVAAALSRDDDEQMSRLARALALDPSNLTMQWYRQQICLRESNSYCSPAEQLARLKVLDPHNVETWLHAAGAAYRRKAFDLAFNAMQQAAQGYYASNYRFETLLLIEEGLRASTLDLQERITLATGIEAAIARPMLTAPVEMCEELARNDSHWRQVCSLVGRRLEMLSKDLQSSHIGHKMQTVAANYANDQETQERLDLRATTDQAWRKTHLSADSLAWQMIADYPEFWFEFVALANKHSEKTAYTRLHNQALLLRDKGWRPPCERHDVD